MNEQADKQAMLAQYYEDRALFRMTGQECYLARAAQIVRACDFLGWADVLAQIALSVSGPTSQDVYA